MHLTQPVVFRKRLPISFMCDHFVTHFLEVTHVKKPLTKEDMSVHFGRKEKEKSPGAPALISQGSWNKLPQNSVA